MTLEVDSTCGIRGKARCFYDGTACFTYVPSDIAFLELDESERATLKNKTRELSARSGKWKLLGMLFAILLYSAADLDVPSFLRYPSDFRIQGHERQRLPKYPRVNSKRFG